MKKFWIILLIGLGSIVSNETQAQVNINVNIGTPTWLPAGYSRVNYYYLPDIDTYYYVPKRQYVYMNRGRWIRSHYVPARHRGYNFHRARKVVYHGSPFTSYRSQRVVYKNHGHPRSYQHSRPQYHGRSREHYRSSRTYYRSSGREHGRTYKRGPHMDRIIR